MYRIALASLTVFVALGLVLGASAAKANIIVNGSFEEGDSPPTDGFTTLPNNSIAISGWKVTGGSIDWVGENYWEASDAVRSIDLNGNAQGGLSLTQILNPDPGKYLLTFDMAGNPEGEPDIKHLDVTVGGVAKHFTFDTFATTTSSMGYVTKSILFDFAGGGPVGLTFASTIAGFYGPVIDNVAVNLVPIPGAALLFGSALAGLGLLRRRRDSAGMSAAAA